MQCHSPGALLARCEVCVWSPEARHGVIQLAVCPVQNNLPLIFMIYFYIRTFY